MVTLLNPQDTEGWVYVGKSTDTKPSETIPTSVQNATFFIEFDTGALYTYDADSHTWVVKP